MNPENKNIFILDSSKVELSKPTHEAIVTITEHEGKDIAVAVVDARKKLEDGNYDGKTIIWPQAYMARMDKFETQRLETIAEALGARVIGVELPGVGISENANAGMGLRQKIDFARGNFDGVARDMLGALNEVVKFKEGEEVEFALYSQGYAEGSSMIKHLGNAEFDIKVKIPKITVFEAVTDSNFNIQLAKIGQEDKITDPITKQENNFTNRYLDENGRFKWLTPPADRLEGGKEKVEALNKRQGLILNLGAAALILNNSTNALVDAIENDKQTGETWKTGVSEAFVNILKFDASVVSRIEKNESSIDAINNSMKTGRAVLTIVSAADGKDGHKHPAVHSMPNIDELSRNFL